MTDATSNTPRDAVGQGAHASLLSESPAMKKRNAAETRFKMYGVLAITVGLAFLIFLTYSILRNGIPAFTQTVVNVEFTLSQSEFDEAESKMLKTAAYTEIFVNNVTQQFVDQGLDVEFDAGTIERLMGKVGGDLRSFYREDPSRIGQPSQFQLPAASRVERYLQGKLTRDMVVDGRFLEVADLDVVDAMVDAGIIGTAFDWNFITGTDTGVDNPGGAGLGASVIGSFFMMLVVLVLFALRFRVLEVAVVLELAEFRLWVFGLVGGIKLVMILHFQELDSTDWVLCG